MTHTKKSETIPRNCAVDSAPGSTDRPGLAGLKRFARNEDGSFIIFGLFMFVLLLLACGMGLDMMRLETARVKLASSLRAKRSSLDGPGRSNDPGAVSSVRMHVFSTYFLVCVIPPRGVTRAP